MRRIVYDPKENFPSLQIFWPCGAAAQENLKKQQNAIYRILLLSIDVVNAHGRALRIRRALPERSEASPESFLRFGLRFHSLPIFSLRFREDCGILHATTCDARTLSRSRIGCIIFLFATLTAGK